MLRRTVVGIPASYSEDQSLETESTIRYLSYLEDQGVHTVMTTAGTSHFNLLNIDEIHALNKAVANSFKGNKIIGVPALSNRDAVAFIERANDYIDSSCRLMLLYPERYYSEDEIVDYMSDLRSHTDNKIYIHGKTIRNATGGSWDYNASVINKLYNYGILQGIKEEHSNLSKSYDFVSEIHPEVDVIVAGGSMRRYEYLQSAGANSFLSGVGNLFPKVEQDYLDGLTADSLNKEKQMFSVFMKYGWHKSLRIALKYLDLTCYHNRKPWPATSVLEEEAIKKVVENIR
jgi:dihydrodipicolinate synthase/N-acetylneuraminate lyase